MLLTDPLHLLERTAAVFVFALSRGRPGGTASPSSALIEESVVLVFGSRLSFVL